MAAVCTHTDQIKKVKPHTKGCEDCMKTGDTWVHLRMCLECGHVGCWTRRRTAMPAHISPETSHPIIQSAERGEKWRWCYIDETYI